MAVALPIPERLARTSVAWEGDAARRWLAALPATVAGVAEAWDLEVGAPFEPGGNISWVAPVRQRGGGPPAVLKVQLPHPESAAEALALRAWDGRAAVRLLDHDPARWALLLERCEPGRDLLAEGGTRSAAEAGAALGASLHAVAPPPGLPPLADVLDAWADELAARLVGHPCPDRALGDLAVEVMRTAPRAGGRSVLLHGDLNPTNVLSARRAPWLAIDPKPMVGDPAYDGPRLVLQPDPGATARPAATLADRLAVVADGLGVAREAVARWCLVHAVERGASASASGDHALAAACAAQVVLVAGVLG
jgi:streptomycin 6-kinase